MTTKYDEICNALVQNKKLWLITGVSGFIGSNLLEVLLKLNQTVIGLDNFSTGHHKNLDEVRRIVGESQWKGFNLIDGDICDLRVCKIACEGVDYVLHQAALGSVPRSISDPILTSKVNIDGFLNILVAAKDANVKRLVYAASSSTYGDEPNLPKIENRIGKPLSPYAVTKYVNELYADVFKSTYDLNTIGLRYFNVFGKRQDPNGSYAAVIPRWINLILKGGDIEINGDGTTSRDFCYIENVCQANILSALSDNENSVNQIYNIAVGERTTLNELFGLMKEAFIMNGINVDIKTPIYRAFRSGDVRHSLADINKAREILGYMPKYSIKTGLELCIPWYLNQFDNLC